MFIIKPWREATWGEEATCAAAWVASGLGLRVVRLTVDRVLVTRSPNW